MAKNKWTEANIPDLSNKIIVVTGANSGLGYESARAMAEHNGTIILACRNTTKGEEAKQQILQIKPSAKIEVMKLDLGSLESVINFVEAFSSAYDRIDILMNNAGVMAPPRRETNDGFEQQLGINHLGHFALTGLLLDKLEASDNARVINVASLAADNGSINFDDLMSTQNYSRFGAYSQSKLANILFTQELNARLESKGFKTRSLVAHPGGSKTNLGESSNFNPVIKVLGKALLGLIAQPASMGALPQLYAAVASEAEAGKYYGPDGRRELGGYPKLANHPESAKNAQAQQKLWEVSEQLTKVSYLS